MIRIRIGTNNYRSGSRRLIKLRIIRTRIHSTDYEGALGNSLSLSRYVFLFKVFTFYSYFVFQMLGRLKQVFFLSMELPPPPHASPPPTFCRFPCGLGSIVFYARSPPPPPSRRKIPHSASIDLFCWAHIAKLSNGTVSQRRNGIL